MKAKVFTGQGRLSKGERGGGQELLEGVTGSGQRLATAGIVSLLFCAGIVLLSGAALRAAAKTDEQVLQGTLITVSGTGPVLKVESKQYPLAGWNSHIFHTLQDKRLQNDEVR